jgi:hypothetical protein
MGILLGLKIVIFGFIIKMIIKAALPVSYATWGLSFSATVASCFWDTLVCRIIMEQVVLIAAGIAVGPEVFNEIVKQEAPVRKEAEVVCIRAIAVAIGIQGQMMPTMELLLRHAVQYFGLEGSTRIEKPDSPLDSIPCFLVELEGLTEKEREMVMCILLLTQVLDGCVESPELLIWSRIYKQIGLKFAPDEAALRGCANVFRNCVYTQRFVDTQLLRSALDGVNDEDDVSATAGLGDSLWYQIRKLLLK